MKLLVSCVPYDKGKSGISVYVREIVRALRNEGHQLTLLVEYGEEGDIHAPKWTRKPVLSMLWHLAVLPFWIARHKKEFDGLVICAANRRVCAWYPVTTVATVHDLANFHVKGKYSALRMFYLAHVLPFFAKKADALIAVSNATKSDMVKFWHVKPERVTTLYNGFTAQWKDAANSSETGRGEAILYISRIEHPGKNHIRLIEAYSKLPKEIAEDHELILAGADWKDFDKVHSAAERSPYSHKIRFTGFVDDIEDVWREAGYYVFPSLFEGFGLSLVESMARGIPCACSNNGSLGEIAGDVAIVFDPEDVEDISNALKKLLSESPDERSKRIAEGYEHIKKFSWHDHAKGIVNEISRRDKAVLFGIPIDKLTHEEAVEKIVQMARRPICDRAAIVATLNVDFVSNAVVGWPFKGNEELWGYLKNADLVTADGMPIVALSRMAGCGLPERVTGADLVPAIFGRFAEEGLSIYVLGATRESLEIAFSKLPHAKIAGYDTSVVKLDEDQSDIIERINSAKPDLLFVALGNPKQELWMGRNASKLKVPVMIGVGGTFNFIAGQVKRAPAWMQKCGVEWIYRIIQEPKRLWRRYAYGLVKFSWLALRFLAGGYRI